MPDSFLQKVKENLGFLFRILESPTIESMDSMQLVKKLLKSFNEFFTARMNFSHWKFYSKFHSPGRGQRGRRRR